MYAKVPARRRRKGATVERLWHWWCREWDFILIWTAIAIIAMLFAGAISATIAAIQAAANYG